MMHQDQNLRLLIGLSEEFVQINEKMIGYQNRTLPKHWDLQKISDFTEQLKSITGEFNKLRNSQNSRRKI